MSSFENLLGLQDIDTSLDQLRHRRDNLPERDELAEAQAEVDRLYARWAELEALRG